MRVLWLCNIMLPAFAKANGLGYSVREGWLSGSYNRIIKSDIELGVAFPAQEPYNTGRYELDGCIFYGFSE
ncbi:MAG: glycosyl transferase 4, partial [Butyrivibrio sp.]|nr:glycosyl transferase 4 [Butyrivibrio sp.]